MSDQKIGVRVVVGTYKNLDTEDTGVFASPLDELGPIYETCIDHDDDPIEVAGYSRGVYLAQNLDELSKRILDTMNLKRSSFALHPAQLGCHSTVQDEWGDERINYLMDKLPRAQFDELYKKVLAKPYDTDI
ncbi:MAG: hypothetical protein KAI26_06315 [Nanoarchaeota archaeon]|nr:hypothetical protein [Nanoarchaeota archaeon]